MKFVLETGSPILIHAYDVGSVSIAGIHADDPELKSASQNPIWNEWDAENQLAIFRKSIILNSNGLMQNWSPQQQSDLNPHHFIEFVEQQPEIIIIGTGRNLCFPPHECLTVLQQHNLGYEIMDTAAACRTFNVLAAEGREVMMGLLMIENDQKN